MCFYNQLTGKNLNTNVQDNYNDNYNHKYNDNVNFYSLKETHHKSKLLIDNKVPV